jgi:hypothetical protein
MVSGLERSAEWTPSRDGLGALAITKVPFEPFCRGGAATTATAAEGDVIPMRATSASSQGATGRLLEQHTEVPQALAGRGIGAPGSRSHAGACSMICCARSFREDAAL